MNNKGGIDRLAGVIACALVANVAVAADLTLYADDDYQGRALGVVIDEKQLGVLNFDKRASSVVVENGAWVLCTGQDYTGQCITLEPGRYASLQALGINDAITSVRRRDPASIGVFGRVDAAAKSATPARTTPSTPAQSRDAAQIVLFAASDYSGASQPLDQPQVDVRSENLANNAASTVISSGTWELCDDTFYRGHCITLGPGKYPSFQEYGLTRGVMSVRRAPK